MIRISCKILDFSGNNLRRVNSGKLGFMQRPIYPKNGIQFLNHASVRYNSSFTLNDGSSLVKEIIQSTEPSLSSLGLGGMTPKGFLQSGLELLHTGLDIPWWSTIVIGTICIRLAVFPLMIISQRNSANLHNHLPTMQGLQKRLFEARDSGNREEVVKCARQLREFMKVNNVSPLKNLLPAVAQIPIFLSVFTGLREMSYLPVESMKIGGMYWFTDLTVPDPLFLLPLMTAATLSLTVEAGVDGIQVKHINSTTFKRIFRVMPIISLPFMLQFPSALLCYWFTSNVFSLMQVLLFKIPRVKRFFAIPELVKHVKADPTDTPTTPKASFGESMRQAIKNMELAKEMEEREKFGSLKMMESTKVKPKPTEESKH